jgi:hypothetical protein
MAATPMATDRLTGKRVPVGAIFSAAGHLGPWTYGDGKRREYVFARGSSDPDLLVRDAERRCREFYGLPPTDEDDQRALECSRDPTTGEPSFLVANAIKRAREAREQEAKQRRAGGCYR